MLKKTEGAWPLERGEQIVRKQLHIELGGRKQGGVSPSRVSPNVFLFSDRKSGEKHGYIDGWQPDGLFHYTGEGQRGDQTLVSGNAAILRHKEEGRAIRLFYGTGGIITYGGEFELDPEHPHYQTDAPETGNGPIRKVIAFRLRPIDFAPEPPHESAILLSSTSQVSEVEVSISENERVFVDPSRKPYEAELLENKLVEAFKLWMEAKGQTVRRFKIVPPGEAKPIFSDLWVTPLNLLVEAKGSCTRECVRMAIGQLADYGRFITTPHERALLLPEKPRDDLVALIHSAGISLFWRDGARFTSDDGQ